MMKTMRIAMVAAGIVGLCNVSAMGAPGVRAAGDRVVLETDRFTYAVGTDGFNKAFHDRRTGRDHQAATGPVPFMAVEKDGQWIGSTAVEWIRGFLHVTFGDSGIRAKVHARAFPNYLTLELTALNDHTISEIHLVRVPMDITQTIGNVLTHCRDDNYAAALIPLNLETHSYVAALEPAIPGDPIPGMIFRGARGHIVPKDGELPVLIAHADRRVRLDGAKVAVIACPTESLLDIIEQVEIDNGLPHPTIDGVWARRSPDQMKSILYTQISEDTADEMIAYAKAGGFTYVHINRPHWCASNGSFLINRKNFPNGEAGLLAVSRKIHAAGLKFGLHNWEMVVHKHDPLVTPVPAQGFLMYPERQRILAADIGPGDSFIPTTTSPRGLLAKGDKAEYHGRDLRIGDEIIIYGDLQTTEPYGFTSCQRGAHGTVTAAHAAGATIGNFAEFYWSHYLPDLQSDLFDRVIRAEAAVLDRFEADYFYPDGSGQNTNYYPPEWLPNWYTRGLSAVKRYQYTRREVRFSHGPVSNHSWHVLTQGNHRDVSQIGFMENFNGSLADAASSILNLTPFDLGWFGYFTHTVTGPATRPREMVYAWSKALAYAAPISLSVDKDRLDGNGRTQEIFAMIRNWEELKIAGYFPERIREQLKEPNREFALEQTAKGKWQVRPVTYAPKKYVAKVDGEQNVWTFESPHPAQPLRVFIEPKPQLAEYGDPANVTLLKPGELKLRTTGAGPMFGDREAPGMAFTMRNSDEDTPGGGNTFDVTAVNQGTNPKGWACAEVILDGIKNIKQHRALGTWVKGDGSGAYLHFTIESGRRNVRDYYVQLDFTGWKYVRMPESAGGEIFDFKFPFSNYYALGIMNFETVDRVYVFITNLPPGATATAGFGRLEALKETPRTLHNPGLTIQGESITFPVRLEPDWYLEYEGGGSVRVFDPNGFTQAEVQPQGVVPTVRKGNNELTFICDRDQGQGETAKITLFTRGKPLK